ncbi:hypothetical protein [Roseateles violae]|uniref:Uncharacterized protein n=1 Tax=Roseateles violae TaxID=3058042 RepID=A0ABT8DWX4_9BURK|nr:hypothetical protein [Pelomonas sp. PFR6]MDN3921514.1 hypothetical protein [Pelomonas sp. PFR6]
MAADRKGESWAVLAASEMGKGVWLKQRLAQLRPAPLIIWDTNDEYDQVAGQVASLAELLATLQRNPKARIRYVPRSRTDKQLRAEFEAWCLLVYHFVGATIVVEELADVTAPSYAPPAWRKLNTRGRHHQGLTLYWCSQSPAFIDKASLGNATHMHVGYLGEPRHRQAAAAHMGCSAEDIDALAQFEFIEYVKATKARAHGRVSLGGSSPRAKKRRPL